MGDRGGSVWWIKVGRKPRRVQITLDRPDATRAVVPALGERLFRIGLTAMAVLGQFGAARGKLAQGAAGTCNRASQVIYEHPWGRVSHTLAELLLPRFVRKFLSTNGVATTDDLMDQSSM